jgi:transposase
VRRPKLSDHVDFIEQVLDADEAAPAKQRHTARRIFERLRDERGFDGSYSTVRDYVRSRRQVRKEVFVPLAHPPGHAQADFGEAVVILGGVEQKIRFFVMDLPQSDAIFVKAYHGETAEAFCDGHVEAFAFVGGVPQSILYDNTKLAVAQILGDGTRRRSHLSPPCNPTTSSTTGTAGRRRGATRVRWRAWSASPAAPSWFRSRAPATSTS